MGYRVGIGLGVAKLFGHTGSTNPHIFCDGCGVVHEFKHWQAPAWFLNGKAKPGWKLIRYEDAETGEVTRQDYCQKCKGASR